jgi:hypothetical protein
MNPVPDLGPNPGRVAGFWYLLLILIGPLRLIYIPNKLFVHGDAAATVQNIASHEWLFRAGMITSMLGAIILVLLTLALYRLFAGVDRNLAAQVVIFGGVMPAVIYFVNVVNDAGALSLVSDGNFLWALGQVQRDAMVSLLLRLHGHLDTASLLLAGAWLFPLATLAYRSRFLPRFLAGWLFLAGCGWVIMYLTGFLFPQYQNRELTWFQPAFLAEIAFMLWLIVRGARPPALAVAASAPSVAAP